MVNTLTWQVSAVRDPRIGIPLVAIPQPELADIVFYSSLPAGIGLHVVTQSSLDTACDRFLLVSSTHIYVYTGRCSAVTACYPLSDLREILPCSILNPRYKGVAFSTYSSETDVVFEGQSDAVDDFITSVEAVHDAFFELPQGASIAVGGDPPRLSVVVESAVLPASFPDVPIDLPQKCGMTWDVVADPLTFVDWRVSQLTAVVLAELCGRVDIVTEEAAEFSEALDELQRVLSDVVAQFMNIVDAETLHRTTIQGWWVSGLKSLEQQRVCSFSSVVEQRQRAKVTAEESVARMELALQAHAEYGEKVLQEAQSSAEDAVHALRSANQQVDECALRVQRDAGTFSLLGKDQASVCFGHDADVPVSSHDVSTARLIVKERNVRASIESSEEFCLWVLLNIWHTSRATKELIAIEVEQRADIEDAWAADYAMLVSTYLNMQATGLARLGHIEVPREPEWMPELPSLCPPDCGLCAGGGQADHEQVQLWREDGTLPFISSAKMNKYRHMQSIGALDVLLLPPVLPVDYATPNSLHVVAAAEAMHRADVNDLYRGDLLKLNHAFVARCKVLDATKQAILRAGSIRIGQRTFPFPSFVPQRAERYGDEGPPSIAETGSLSVGYRGHLHHISSGFGIACPNVSPAALPHPNSDSIHHRFDRVHPTSCRPYHQESEPHNTSGSAMLTSQAASASAALSYVSASQHRVSAGAAAATQAIRECRERARRTFVASHS